MANCILWCISKETDSAVDRESSSESDDNEEQCRTGDILDIEVGVGDIEKYNMK